MAHLIEELTVGSDFLKLKFRRYIKAAAITNENFELSLDGTPVDQPFKPIDLVKDYNSISRVLVLHLKAALSPNSTYEFLATGLEEPTGTIIADESAEFLTQDAPTPEPTPEPTPTPGDYTVKDFSLKSVTSETVVDTSDFKIVNVSPKNGDFLLDETYNDGRITVKFSTEPASSFVNNKYFRVQRKKISRNPVRWEKVEARVTKDNQRPWVYIDFPSGDATPVYTTNGSTYFETGYKYRLTVSGEVRAQG